MRRDRKFRRENDLNLALYVSPHVIYVTFDSVEARNSFLNAVSAGSRSVRKLRSQGGFDFYVRPSAVHAYRFNRG